MKILWICNIILPQFSEEYRVKKNVFGGWISGMLSEIEKYKDVEVGLCFPIRTTEKMIQGKAHNHRYFSMEASDDIGIYNPKTEEIFEKIIEDFKPDIVHIWGTEYSHSRTAVEVCVKRNIQNRTIIDIQGLVSVYAKHYHSGIEINETQWCNSLNQSIESERNNFEIRGVNEIFDIRNVKWVSGRTDWDRICSKQINPDVHYFKCHRILREEYYKQTVFWNVNKIERHTIFVSQGTYSIKGLHFLLRALPIVKKSYKDVKVYIAGTSPLHETNGEISPYGHYIRGLISELDIVENVDFIGQITVDEMIKYYLRVNVSVSPSNVENPSNSICEAMYIGTPMIASYVGGCNEIINHGKDGLFYPHDAEYMLAGYICDVFADDILAQNLSENGKRSARERHNPSKLGKIMYENYKTIMAVEKQTNES